MIVFWKKWALIPLCLSKGKRQEDIILLDMITVKLQDENDATIQSS